MVQEDPFGIPSDVRARQDRMIDTRPRRFSATRTARQSEIEGALFGKPPRERSAKQRRAKAQKRREKKSRIGKAQREKTGQQPSRTYINRRARGR